MLKSTLNTIRNCIRLILLSALLSVSACGGGGSGEVVTQAQNTTTVTGSGGGETPTADGWAIFDAPPSGRANQAVIVDGEFVGTDEIHFARGANADGIDHEQYYAPGGVPPEPEPSPQEQDDAYRHLTWGAFGADRAPHNGDYLLPTDTDRWPDFTADIGHIRLEATATELFIQLRFLSFPAPDKQIASLTFAPAGALPSASTPWPRNAGVSSRFTHVLTLWGSSGELLQTGVGATDLAAIGGQVRITDHAIEARLPLALLPVGPWRIGVGAGLADPQDVSQYWTVPPGAPTADSPGTDSDNAPGANVWDLMFTPRNPEWFDDHVQANLLASGEVSDAGIVIDPAQLQARQSLGAPVITGRVAHTYESAFDFGDGITRGSPGTPPVFYPGGEGVRPRDPAVNYEYTGGIQPYFAYIPQAYPASTHDWPLILYFHGLNNYIWEPFGLTLGLEEELESRGYLFASLLGRGDISYEGRGELDPLEVIAHMSERYRIDPDRIYLMGHSHGAGGVLNVSRRNPDLFAAVVPAQITSAPAQPENLRHLPTIHIAGMGDPIDNGNSARQRYDALSALGYDTQLFLYTMKTHENSSIYDSLPQIFDLFDRSTRPLNPASVVFTRAGGDFDTALGLEHDQAYWVSDMLAVNPEQDMHISAESFAIEHRPLEPSAAQRSGDQLVDNGGPSGRTVANYAQTIPGFAAPVTLENRASLQTRNLAAAKLNTARMGLNLVSDAAQFDVRLDSDLLLTLAGVPGSALSWQVLNAAGEVLDSGAAPRIRDSFTIPVVASADRVITQP